MNKRYCISDIHGRWDLFNIVLNKILDNSDTLYILGDCGDRGPDGWKCITVALTDKRCKYLMGNHEKMLLETANLYNTSNAGEFQDAYARLTRNGGRNTFEEMLLDKNKNYYLSSLKKLPYFFIIENKDNKKILLNHSGFEPEDIFNLTEEDKRSILWDRYHYIVNQIPTKFDYIIHGHTPIECLVYDINETKIHRGDTNFVPEWNGDVYFYCDGRKIDIDVGAYFHNYTALLDLDDFSSIIIKGE